MKKYIFIILLFLLAYEAYPQVSLSTRDSVTSFQPIDLFWLQRKVTGSFVNRKVSWSYLRSNMIDYIDGLANTWALRQTFSKGATFSAASYGAVIFEDTLWNAGTSYLRRIYPTTSSTSQIGTLAIPYNNIYAVRVTVTNSGGTDSAYITLNSGGEISIPELSITQKFSMDSAAAIQSLKLSPNSYAITDVKDTVITVASLMSNIQLTLPGDVTTGIETINMDGAAIGHIILLYTTDVDDSVLFRDAASDGNLKMAGNLWLRTGDNIAFMYIYDQSAAAFIWMELWRKNN